MPEETPQSEQSAAQPVAQVVDDINGGNKRVIFYSMKALHETPVWTKLYAAAQPVAQEPVAWLCVRLSGTAWVTMSEHMTPIVRKVYEDDNVSIEPLYLAATPQSERPALLTRAQQIELANMLLSSVPATREEVEAEQVTDEELAPLVAKLHARMAALATPQPAA